MEKKSSENFFGSFFVKIFFDFFWRVKIRLKKKMFFVRTPYLIQSPFLSYRRAHNECFSGWSHTQKAKTKIWPKNFFFSDTCSAKRPKFEKGLQKPWLDPRQKWGFFHPWLFSFQEIENFWGKNWKIKKFFWWEYLKNGFEFVGKTFFFKLPELKKNGIIQILGRKIWLKFKGICDVCAC